MRLFIILFILLLQVGLLSAQETKRVLLYRPTDNARNEISGKIKIAKEKNKHVLVQIGNNGCSWCYRFHDFIKKDKGLDSMLVSNYELYHLNTSPENKNEKLLASYGFPQRFGYPVFLVINAKGMVIHTQNSVYLEEGATYNRQKIMEFLEQWSPRALNPETYK